MTFKQTVVGAIVLFFILHLVALYFVFLKPATIAYVDSNKLLENYDGMKAARQAFQQKALQWQANIDTLKSEVDKEIEMYEAGKGKMTAKERALNEKLIQTKKQQFVDYQKGIQQKSQQEDFQMTEQVLTEVNAFIEDYGRKNGYSIILGATNAGNIVYAKEGLDITAILQEKLNDNYLGF